MRKIHKNIVWLFILAFFVGESLLILVGSINFKSKLNYTLKDYTTQLKTSYESIFNTYELASDIVFEQIINKPEVLSLYSRAYKSNEKRQAEIRDSLYQMLNPVYLGLKTNVIKYLHFHLPDNRSFLRFHSPEKFGDDLTDVRESVRIANAEKILVQGFENGKIYNGFRFVYPLSYKGKHIGTVETSISFGVVNDMLYKQANNVYAFILKKSVLDKNVFDDEKSNYVKSALSDNWVEEKKFLHYDNTGENFTKETLEKLDRIIKKKYQNKLNENQAFSVFVNLKKSKYIVSFVPIINIKKEYVAYIISYTSDNYSNRYINSFITFIIVGSLLVLIITILFYVIYFKNITIESQHGALVESEERYKHIYNTIDIGIITTTLDGRIILANTKLLDLLNCKSLEELQTRNIQDFYVKPEERKTIIDNLSSEKSNRIEGEILWKNTNEKPLLIKFSTKKHIDNEGNPFAESVIQDITALRALEDSLKISELSLRKSNAAKDQFFSILAHDLRGPFNSLLGLTEIIALYPETIEEGKKTQFIQSIYRSIKNLYNLIENLLEWSRTQNGTISFNPTEVELKALVQNTINLLSEVVSSKEIDILANISSDIKLIADENMLKTIIRNLISNSIKFTHKNGLIKIYLGKTISKNDKDFIEIIVEDNGVGINKNDIDKLFKIESDFTNAGTEGEKGSGLGLVLVNEFVKKHEGSIKIESKKEVGTKVIFTFPILS